MTLGYIRRDHEDITLSFVRIGDSSKLATVQFHASRWDARCFREVECALALLRHTVRYIYIYVYGGEWGISGVSRNVWDVQRCIWWLYSRLYAWTWRDMNRTSLVPPLIYRSYSYILSFLDVFATVVAVGYRNYKFYGGVVTYREIHNVDRLL